MSRSPRRLLRTAADALQALHEVCERYPDARAELEGALDEAGLADLERARRAVIAAAGAVEQARAPEAGPPGQTA